MPPPQRQKAAVHSLERLVDVWNRDRHPHGAAILLGDHEPVAVIDDLESERQLVEVLLRVGHKTPVPRPGRVVDGCELVELAPQPAARHPANRDSVLVARSFRKPREYLIHALIPVGQMKLPVKNVLGLGQARGFEALVVVRGLPRLLDHRLEFKSIDQHPALLVH